MTLNGLPSNACALGPSPVVRNYKTALHLTRLHPKPDFQWFVLRLLLLFRTWRRADLMSLCQRQKQTTKSPPKILQGRHPPFPPSINKITHPNNLSSRTLLSKLPSLRRDQRTRLLFSQIP